MKKAIVPAHPFVARLLVTLRDVNPLVWRRIEVPIDINFAQLHALLQEAMGWTDSHLHEFRIGTVTIGIDDGETDERPINEERARFSQRVHKGLRHFEYEYDFGDGWIHDVVVEDVSPPERSVRYPRVVSGARACPPEDCGGPYGYEELLEVLGEPIHEAARGHAELGGRIRSRAVQPRREGQCPAACLGSRTPLTARASRSSSGRRYYLIVSVARTARPDVPGATGRRASARKKYSS